MKKHILIGATARAIILPGLSSGVLAAPREQASDHHQLFAEHEAAFTDARIAALKVGLKPTPTQEPSVSHSPVLINFTALQTWLTGDRRYG
jgi:hypothetical protein